MKCSHEDIQRKAHQFLLKADKNLITSTSHNPYAMQQPFLMLWENKEGVFHTYGVSTISTYPFIAIT